MDRPVFEVRRTDAAGRLGRLEIPRAGVTVETPAMLPVVNPHLQLIEPERLAAEFGAELLITNAYVLHGSDDLREAAIADGLHDLLEFPGAIMTDSGSFQLAEYGDIDVDTAEILAFQDAIGSDIATPVDLPTPPDADRARAERELEETRDALATAADYDAGDMLLTGPIQGGSFPDLRERAARDANELNLDLYPIGAVVPLLRAYRFDEVVEIVGAAQRGLGRDAPTHLFGAGHPMMFALGVALGIDLFDSAAYALYARDDRYLTVTGTVAVEELTHLPCHCPVCAETDAATLTSAAGETRERLLSAHNLHVTFGEIRRVKQAIARGELLELVELRARAHPRMLDGYRTALELVDLLDGCDPSTGARPFFYLSSESADRPEVRRHHQRLARVAVPAELALIDPAVGAAGPASGPWNTTDPVPLEADLEASLSAVSRWFAIPPFGPVPPALLETYPLTAELPSHRDERAFVRAADGIATLLEANETTVTLVHAGWPSAALDRLPEIVSTVCRPERGGEDSSGPAMDPAA